RRPRHPGNQLQQRRLPGTVPADHAEAGALLDLERGIAKGPNRGVDPPARRAVDFVGPAPQSIDGARNKIDNRPRAAGAVALGDAIELNRDRHVIVLRPFARQITSAKYLSIRLNITNAAANTAAEIAV